MRSRIKKYVLDSSSNKDKHMEIKKSGNRVIIFANTFNPHNAKILNRVS